MTSMTTGRVTRRDWLTVVGVSGVAATAGACGPAAAPVTPAAGPESRSAWEAEWDRLAERAKQEGKLSLLTRAGPGFRQGAEAFEAAFPGLLVAVEYETSSEWWQGLPDAPQDAGSPPPEDTRLHETRRELVRAREEVLQLRQVCDERLRLIEQLHSLGQTHLRIIDDLRSRA